MKNDYFSQLLYATAPINTDMWSIVNYNFFSGSCNPLEKTRLFYNPCVPGYSCILPSGYPAGQESCYCNLFK